MTFPGGKIGLWRMTVVPEGMGVGVGVAVGVAVGSGQVWAQADWFRGLNKKKRASVTKVAPKTAPP